MKAYIDTTRYSAGGFALMGTGKQAANNTNCLSRVLSNFPALASQQRLKLMA